MRRILLAIVLLGAAVLAPASAQPALSRRVGTTVADTGAPGYRFEQFRVDSADGQRHYRVRVAVPTRSAPPQGFPVAYLLDGNAALMEVDAALLARLADASRPPVIAFIAYDSDLRIEADSRAFDYTPRRPGGDDAQRDAIGGRSNGGADAFLALIETSIAPRVQALAALDGTRRALWGHSYGGVFVLHTLFTHPRAFDLYAAADPSLWWGGGHLLKEESTRPTATDTRVLLWVGDAESSSEARQPPPGRDPKAVQAMRQARRSVPPDATAQMAARLRQSGMPVTFTTLPGLSHGQTLGASLPLLLDELSGDPEKGR
ncbi:alpha/beta hydrolase-fold protein [Lysobacter sp. LF1]|uniref:Alpha/beta hydrolase-fold protein n=1 Tax=Lysobacter stagni TaxID=3045172 RepID=A0ABT6XEU7_9GAMM|nr:alpha/beta hydrolase-fold protein [Lysobacter sp. LF1]MDI9238564.1 alpha/beta hydrolase-fold protein [Lysobacter sp. LF1]